MKYFKRIQSIAGESIEWVTLEDDGFDMVLLIQGCDTGCPEKNTDFSLNRRIVSIKNDDLDPKDVVKIILGEVKNEN